MKQTNKQTCLCLSCLSVPATGLQCQTNMDDCDPDPCENGGTCGDRVADYACACSPRWMGKNCSQVYDACLSLAPCRNNATCNTTTPQATYTCTCLSGFTGSDCETNIDDCVGHTCRHFEHCYDGINNYTCACPIGEKSKHTRGLHERFLIRTGQKNAQTVSKFCK